MKEEKNKKPLKNLHIVNLLHKAGATVTCKGYTIKHHTKKRAHGFSRVTEHGLDKTLACCVFDRWNGMAAVNKPRKVKSSKKDTGQRE